MSKATHLLLKGLRSILGKKIVPLKDEARFMGKDKYGNIYYEIDKPGNAKRPVQRFFNRETLDENKALVDYAHVPPAWDAWLRFRRKEAPSELEITESEEYFKIQQELAEKKKVEEGDKPKVNNKSSRGIDPKQKTFKGPIKFNPEAGPGEESR